MLTDVQLAKLASVEQCLARIGTVTGGRADSLDDLDTRDIFVLNLQRAVQQAMDLAATVVRAERLGLVTSGRDAFALLRDRAGLPASLADQMMNMVGFRNIAIHEYQKLDLAILKRILTDHTGDLATFVRWVAQRTS